jgi:hypothetical protein
MNQNLVGSILGRSIKKKSTNQKQEWPVATMLDNGSGQNEQSL